MNKHLACIFVVLFPSLVCLFYRLLSYKALSSPHWVQRSIWELSRLAPSDSHIHTHTHISGDVDLHYNTKEPHRCSTCNPHSKKDAQTLPKAYTQPDKLYSSEGSAGARARSGVSADMITVSEIAAGRSECFERRRERELSSISDLNHTRTDEKFTANGQEKPLSCRHHAAASKSVAR